VLCSAWSDGVVAHWVELIALEVEAAISSFTDLGPPQTRFTRSCVCPNPRRALLRAVMTALGVTKGWGRRRIGSGMASAVTQTTQIARTSPSALARNRSMLPAGTGALRRSVGKRWTHSGGQD
jgi:hypothetical protein